MLYIDAASHVAGHSEELLAEAARERLAAQLPARHFGVRHELALACHRLANWLDDPSRYVQRLDSGREDWVRPWASV